MRSDVHFALLESPSHALRVACGAWRAASNWTTVPGLVTCPVCRQRAPFICAREARSPGAPAAIAPGAEATRSTR